MLGQRTIVSRSAAVRRFPGRGEFTGDPVADARLAGATRHHDAAARVGRAPALVRPSADVLQSFDRRVDDSALDLVPRVGVCVIRDLRRLQQLVLEPQAPNLGEPPVVQLFSEPPARYGRPDDPCLVELGRRCRSQKPFDVRELDLASLAPSLALDRDQPFVGCVFGHEVDGDVVGRAVGENRRPFRPLLPLVDGVDVPVPDGGAVRLHELLEPFAVAAVVGVGFDLSQCLANFVRHWCFRALSMWVLF